MKLKLLFSFLLNTLLLNPGLFASNGVQSLKNQNKSAPTHHSGGHSQSRVINISNTINTAYWSDDFSIASNWSISTQNGTSDNWVIGTNGPAGPFAINIIASSSASNGFALFDSDLYCSGTQDATLTTAGNINLGSATSATLQFTQYYRRYFDSTFVYISSNGGIAWTEIPLNINTQNNNHNSNNDPIGANPEVVTIDITNLAAGQDSVKIRFRFLSNQSFGIDGGCAYSWQIDDVLIYSCSIAGTISATTNARCNGENDGSATFSVTGATGVTNYLWSNGSTTATNSGLAAGTYSVLATDAAGCTASASTVITQPTVLNIVTSGTNPTTFGATNGSVTATPTGGTPPYNYLWSNGTASATASGLGIGTYTVTITDANGCTKTGSQTLTTPCALTTIITSRINVSCNGGNNGSATASVSGANGAVTYLWSNGNTAATNSGLAAGAYSVLATDAAGCTASASTVITQPTALNVVTSGTNPTTFGAANGSVTATPSGGTTPYNYLWSNGAMTSLVTGLSANTYSVTVTDAKGCTQTGSTTLINPNGILVQDVAIACQSNSATLIANPFITGGTYSWQPGGATTQSITVAPGVTSDYICSYTYNGVTYRDTATVYVLYLQSFNLEVNYDTLCATASDSLQLFASWHWANLPPAPTNYPVPLPGINLDEQIYGVVFGPMINHQLDYCVNNYNDYTSTIPAISVCKGGTYPFSVITDECDGAPYYWSGLSIYIDYNQDAYFDEILERAYTTSSLTISPNTRTGTITIPNTALIGKTRMRIIVDEGAISPSPNTPLFYGETEDYLLEIGPETITNNWSVGIQGPSWISQNPSNTETYLVTSTSNAGCMASDSIEIPVLPSPQPNITGPASSCGGSTYTLDAGAGYRYYEWYLNDSLVGYGNDNILNLSAGLQGTTDQFVVNYDFWGCSTSDTLDVINSAFPDEVPICMVTVDSTSQFNQIIWQKSPIADAVDSFIVYREITANNYQLIGVFERSRFSVFTDANVNVGATNYRYKIAWKDTCGNTGPQSLYHSTIHLQSLGPGSFQWTPYSIESSSNPVSSYNVYRDDYSTGNFQLLQVVSGNNSTYSDVNYSSFPNASYVVDVNWDSSVVCNPSARTTAAYLTSRSNIKRNTSVGISSMEESAAWIHLSPNPAHEWIRVDFAPTQAQKMAFQLRDAIGKTLSDPFFIQTKSGINTITLPISHLASGLYFLDIFVADRKFTQKLIVE